MSIRKVVVVVSLAAILFVLAGLTPAAEMKLNLAPKSETVYKVVTGSGKDYQFVQPSINKTKAQHTIGKMEMVFAQKIESVDSQGNAVANITIKQLKYFSETPQGKKADFDSTKDPNKSDPLSQLIGASYKIKIAPAGGIEVIDTSAARSIIKSGSVAGAIADKLFSDEEMARRHQVMAMFDAGKCLCEKDRRKEAKTASSNKKANPKDSKKVSNKSCKKGDQWSSIEASPSGMLSPKTFEKIYTLTDLKKQNGQTIAVVDMNAAPSSKRAEDLSAKEPAAGFFAKMFDEKDKFTGKMVINLTTGEIDSYQETLKAEWFAAETSEDQKSDKGPDQLCADAVEEK